MTEFREVRLATGVTLNVAIAGPADAPPVILLHGFPESHRTWRELAPRIGNRLRLIMPDQRGFAGSDKPQEVECYETGKLVDDVFALADALAISRFALVGHDWGGAVAWAAALRGSPRLTRVAVVNSPHPLIFQKTLIEDSDQRAASQYITAFRAAGIETYITSKGWEWFFEKTFSNHVDPALIPESEKRQYIAEWSQPDTLTAMLNWYRASRLVVPPPGVTVPVPDILLKVLGSRIEVPVLAIWGMRDKALLPVQLEGLDEVVDDLQIFRIAAAGHFAPWEAPDEVAAALLQFLEDG